MHELLKHAFLHVDILGPHVRDGHFDLVGPTGDIILPVLWDTLVEPGWSVGMKMWPISEPPPQGPPGTRPRGPPLGASQPPRHVQFRGPPPHPPQTSASANAQQLGISPLDHTVHASGSNMKPAASLSRGLPPGPPPQSKGPPVIIVARSDRSDDSSDQERKREQKWSASTLRAWKSKASRLLKLGR